MKIKRPLIIPTAAVGVISSVATFLNPLYAIILSVSAGFVCGLMVFCRKKEYLVTAIICLLLSVILAGNYAIMNKQGGEIPNEICGEVDEADANQNGVNYVIRVTKGKLFGSKIKVQSKNAYFAVGDAVNIKAELYADDYSGNRAEKIFYSGKLTGVNSVSSTAFGSLLEGMRNKITEKLFKYMSADSAATFSALMVGDREFLSDDFANRVKNAGLSHVLVVSGMHMAILVGGFYAALKKSKLSKWAVSVISICFTLLFMALCGFTPSVMRAGITYFIMILSSVFLRKSDALSSLCAAVIIMTMLNPFIFGSVSFLLSASATAGVLVVYPWLLSKYDFKNKFLSAIWQAVLISLSAVICTAPITLIFFGTVNIMAIITSVLVSLPITFALVLGAVAAVISFVPFVGEIARFPFFITDILIKYFNAIVKFFG